MYHWLTALVKNLKMPNGMHNKVMMSLLQ